MLPPPPHVEAARDAYQRRVFAERSAGSEEAVPNFTALQLLIGAGIPRVAGQTQLWPGGRGRLIAGLLLLSAADPAAERPLMSAIVYREVGDSVWDRFNQDAGKAGTIGYYRGLVTAYQTTGRHPRLVAGIGRGCQADRSGSRPSGCLAAPPGASRSRDHHGAGLAVAPVETNHARAAFASDARSTRHIPTPLITNSTSQA